MATREEVYELAEAAQEALRNGTITQSTPLAMHAIRTAIRYERYGQYTAPSDLDTLEVDREAQTRFRALPCGAV